MRAAILQPSYLPWLGYFEQLAHVDVFVFLDDVQYTRSDWRNRNRIKTRRGPQWISVPVRRTGLHKKISEALIDYTSDWRRRHLALLRENYRTARYFDEVIGIVARRLAERPAGLSELCVALVRDFAAYLAIATPTVLASRLGVEGRDPNERLIRLCERVGATEFYEGRAGTSYLDTGRFAQAGVSVVYQDFRHPEYTQSYPPFTSHLSAIDLLFHHGRESAGVIRSGHGSIAASAVS